MKKQPTPKTIRISPDLWAELQALAQKQGKKRNRLVVETLKHLLIQNAA
jgi:predicted transcriptional regulator